MRFLIDVCLSPDWVCTLAEAGHDAIHWASIGSARATDVELIGWAMANDRIVFTHDLDFGAILAATKAVGPSVLQLREQDTDPASLGPAVIAAIEQCRGVLEAGALVTVDLRRAKARILPIRR